MIQYNTFNVKLSNWHLNKLKSGIQNGTQVTLKLLLNVVGKSYHKNNFPHKLLLTSTQNSRLRKAFANNSSAHLKLSNTQLHKIGYSGLSLEALLKTSLPLMTNVLTPLAKSVLIWLG